jgi:hypothetical protein
MSYFSWNFPSFEIDLIIVVFDIKMNRVLDILPLLPKAVQMLPEMKKRTVYIIGWGRWYIRLVFRNWFKVDPNAPIHLNISYFVYWHKDTIFKVIDSNNANSSLHTYYPVTMGLSGRKCVCKSGYTQAREKMVLNQ